MTETLPSPAADAPPADTIEPFTPPNTDPRWAALAAPFPPDEIEKLPKALSRNDEVKYQCQRGTQASADGFYCGKYHARSIHLDYVGHAGVTTRLNQVDPTWTWEPMYRDVPQDVLLAAIATGNERIVRMVIDNAPMLPTQGGLWIRLTVLGVTRPGFGDAKGKGGPDAIKEIIGDAIRNAAMRFGVATYLWSKSDKARGVGSDTEDDAPTGRGEQPAPRAARPAASPQVTRPSNPATIPAPEGETAPQRAIRQRREADAARLRGNGNGQPQPAQPTPRPTGGDPDTAALVEEILRATRDDQIARLWGQSATAQPDGRHSDVRGYVSDLGVVAEILAPIFAELKVDPRALLPVGALVVAAGRHLTAEGGMSIHDHVAAETAVVDPATGQAVTPPADAVTTH